ncbi:hypothetical protein FRC08_009952 [Ceratobasidium sp. 394]|nr:hypothetical protein FRC08_009952 [Ceratobasidium sp. 394]
MPITSNSPASTVFVHQPGSSVFTLSEPPPARTRRIQPAPVPSGLASDQQSCRPTSPVCSPRSPTSRRRPPITSRSPPSSFFSFVDSRNTIRRGSAYDIGLGVPGAPLPSSSLNAIVAFASGKSHRRSISGPLPGTAWSFETHFAPSPKSIESPVPGLALATSPTRPIPTPIHILFERTRTLAALKANLQGPSSPQIKPKRSKARPAPVMATKDGHVNVLLLPKRRDKESAPSLRSNTSASTSASKSKSKKDSHSVQASSSSGKTPRAASNPALRAQRSLTPARDTFRPLPYATHAALDEFFGDPRKMNALHAHQSSSNQLGARPGEIGYGTTIGHKGADGWIWFDALEEQEYAWLMGEPEALLSPETPQPRKEKKKSKRRGLLGRRGSTTSESDGGRTDWESFDALRRGSESGTSEGGIVDPMTYDLDPTRPPRYRAAADGSARYRVDVTAWDAAVQVRGRQSVGGTSTPKSRRGRSRRGSASHGASAAERRRPPPLNLAAVSSTLASLGPNSIPAVHSPPNLAARRPSLPLPARRLPPSLAEAARADFVSSSFQPHPSKRDLNLDPETPWSANLPKETIYRTIGPVITSTPVPAAPSSPFKSMFARRASFTPLPLKHNPLPLPQSNTNLSYEFKGAPANGSLPKLPPMPTESGAPVPAEGRRKTSLADIFRKGFSSRGGRK